MSEAPKEIPPEAVKEYADIMEGLVGSHLAPGESDGRLEEDEQRQEEDGMYPDPDLLSYIDELCSQEVFVSKVGPGLDIFFLADPGVGTPGFCPRLLHSVLSNAYACMHACECV